MAKFVGARITSPTILIVWGLLSILLGVTGPFGTYEAMSFGIRITYWSGLLALSIVLSVGLKEVVDQVFRGLPPTLREAVLVVLFSALFTPILRFVGMRLDDGQSDYVMAGGETFATVAAIAVCVTVIRTLLSQSNRGPNVRPPPAPPLAPPEPFRPRLLARLPDVGAASVIRLSVRDHYVEVYLSDRTCLRVLMRFADAVAEMDGVPGVCTHRSHWVTQAAVVGSGRVNGKDQLHLADGTVVPVSRTYRPGVVAAGLLGRDRP